MGTYTGRNICKYKKDFVRGENHEYPGLEKRLAGNKGYFIQFCGMQKIKSIHFAESPQELAAFVKCDMASYLQSYQNIVSCDIGKFAMKNYRVEGEHQYIDVCREVRVLRDCGSFLQVASGVVAMTLAKKRSCKLKNDIAMYRCNGCGASISLVEGGKCRYCGNEMDYATYDWVVTDYKHVNEL